MVHQRLASAEVTFFYLLLCASEPAIPIAECSDLALPLLCKFFSLSRSKAALEDVIVECGVAAEGARIALPTAAANQLPVDTRRFMPFAADDMQTAEFAEGFLFGTESRLLANRFNHPFPAFPGNFQPAFELLLESGPCHFLRIAS